MPCFWAGIKYSDRNDIVWCKLERSRQTLRQKERPWCCLDTRTPNLGHFMRQVSFSTQLHVQATLNYIQNYSKKFKMHSRNPVLICYYNECDTYRAQYFPSSSCSFFPFRKLAIDTLSVLPGPWQTGCCIMLSKCVCKTLSVASHVKMFIGPRVTNELYISYHIWDKWCRNILILLSFVKPTSFESNV